MAEDNLQFIIDKLGQACRELGFLDYMPSQMIGHFVKQAVTSAFHENEVKLDQFYHWVRMEYSVPDHVFSRVFTTLSETAHRVGISVTMPRSFKPRFDEKVKEWLRYDVGVEGEPDAPAPAPPPAAREDRVGIEDLIDYDETGELVVDPGELIVGEIIDDDEISAEGYSEEVVLIPLEAEVVAYDDLVPEEYPAEKGQPPPAQAQREEDQLKLELRESVRQELRRELWDEVRREVKADLSSVLQAEADQKEKEEAPKGTGMVDQLAIIKALRERLSPSIREKVISEFTALARAREEEDRKRQLEEMLDDRDFCLDQIRAFLFPDQPALWKKIEPLVDFAQWRDVIRLLSENEKADELDWLTRQRSIMREALRLKAEIGAELGIEPNRQGPRPAMSNALTGADEMLDFVLKNVSDIISDNVNSPFGS